MRFIDWKRQLDAAAEKYERDRQPEPMVDATRRHVLSNEDYVLLCQMDRAFQDRHC
jgi:hypothetical protein